MGSGFLEMTPYIKLAEDEARKRKRKTKQLTDVSKSMTELQTIITLSCEIIKADTLHVLKLRRRCRSRDTASRLICELTRKSRLPSSCNIWNMSDMCFFKVHFNERVKSVKVCSHNIRLYHPLRLNRLEGDVGIADRGRHFDILCSFDQDASRIIFSPLVIS